MKALIDALQRQIEERQSHAARIDAYGLIPVGCGIFLNGVPEDLAKIPVIALPLVAGATAWTWWLARPAFRQYWFALRR